MICWPLAFVQLYTLHAVSYSWILYYNVQSSLITNRGLQISFNPTSHQNSISRYHESTRQSYTRRMPTDVGDIRFPRYFPFAYFNNLTISGFLASDYTPVEQRITWSTGRYSGGDTTGRNDSSGDSSSWSNCITLFLIFLNALSRFCILPAN